MNSSFIISRKFPSSLLILLSASISFFIYFALTDRKRRHKCISIQRENANENERIPGLYNVGRTCYLNSLLQAFASSNYFMKWITQFRVISKNDTEGFVSLNALRELLTELNDNSIDYCSTDFLISAMQKDFSKFHFRFEQDIHELLDFFVKTWENEIITCANPSKNAICQLDLRNFSTMKNRIASSTMNNSLSNSNSELNETKNMDNKVINVSKEISSFNGENLVDNSLEQSIRSVVEELVYSVDNNSKHNDANNAEDNLENMATTVSVNSSAEINSILINLNDLAKPERHALIERFLNIPCAGVFSIRLRCAQPYCGYKTYSEQKFYTLSLVVPNTQEPQDLTCLLSSFFREEVLIGSSCEYCMKKRRKENLISKQSLTKLPLLLLIRLERVGCSTNGYLFKKKTFLRFPSYLDLRNYYMQQNRLVNGGVQLPFSNVRMRELLSEEESCSILNFGYKLCAVSYHVGKGDSGHFITYRQGIGVNRNKWYKANDAMVTTVSYAEVSRCEAYMLYYERLNQNLL